MDDREIRHALRSLPRSRAGDGFTGRVLARLDEAPRRRRALVPGLVAAALLVAAVALPLVWHRPPVPPAPAAAASRLEALRQERQLLASELEDLKRLAAEPPPPVLYLGGDEAVDLVLDLGELARRRPPAGVRPAAFGPEGS